MKSRRDELVEAHLDLVRQLAIRLARRIPACFEVDDLVQQGCLGLIEAAERYDPRKNDQFAAYARPRIKGAMLDSIRRRHWTAAFLGRLDDNLDTDEEEQEAYFYRSHHHYEIRPAA